jgi:transcriptional regulator with XRE-family HTH domain
MTADRPEEAQRAVDAFIAELRHWREVAGFSQKALASLVGYTPSYVSKVEHGSIVSSRAFAESADNAMKAGRALIRQRTMTRRRRMTRNPPLGQRWS